MSRANVRCVGKSTVGEPTPGNRTITKTPCPWTGKRYPSVERDWARLASEDQVFEERATAKPCPRCGSPVQLIPEAQR